MGVIARIIGEGMKAQRILDIPAGNGLFAGRLRQSGHQVVCADINRERPDYIFADLNETLPFADAEFDTCVCMEGIEHVMDSAALIGEFCRVTKSGGRIILSLPNIQNAFSRLTFLCTGYFFQFSPWSNRHLRDGEQIDRGHVAPLSYLQLRYLFQAQGARLTSVAGDRWKKKWLIPLVVPFLAVGWVWARWNLSRQNLSSKVEAGAMLDDLFSPDLLFSRSMILVFERE